MNIEGLSESTIEKFVVEGYLSNYMDIYGLKAYGDKIKAMKGFGEKSCNKLLEAVEKSKNCNLENFIYALGIRHIGLANAKLLSRHFKGDIERIINASEEEILEIDGFGGIMARSVIDFCPSGKHNAVKAGPSNSSYRKA
jgi:DNA ligase (NAD+)